MGGDTRTHTHTKPATRKTPQTPVVIHGGSQANHPGISQRRWSCAAQQGCPRPLGGLHASFQLPEIHGLWISLELFGPFQERLDPEKDPTTPGYSTGIVELESKKGGSTFVVFLDPVVQPLVWSLGVPG